MSKLGRLIALRSIPDDMPPARRARARDHFEAARTRLSAAGQLFDARNFVASVILYRDAIIQLARCHLVVQPAAPDADPSATPDTPSEADALAALRAALADQPRLGAKLGRAVLALEATDGLELDRLPPAELRQRAEELDELGAELAAFVEPRSSRARRTIMARRWAILGAVLVLPPVAFGLYKIIAPPNIALGKPVTTSGASLNTRPEQVVDGDRYGSFGFHSTEHESPWVTIDLGKRYAVRKVDVYGRHDCCFEQSTPIVVEASLDNQQFAVVARRDAPFEHAEPWSVAANYVSARYLRIRTLRKSVLVLSEVQVWGDVQR